MIQDPYRVLGLSPDASDDEVKAAYKRLAKKYHPDVNQGSAEAEARMKEINSAYAQIMKNKNGRASAGYSGAGGGYRPYGGAAEEQDSPQMRAAVNYINTGYYHEALNVLEGIREHTARWYYLSAVANAYLGNTLLAVNHAQQAVNMEPDNFEYHRLLSQLNGGAHVYRERSGQYAPPAMGFGGLCLSMLLARLFCGCGYPCC